MQKRKLQCPVCKATHEIYLKKHTYDCPSCGRKVRAMTPVVAKHDQALKVKEEELAKKAVEEAQKAIEAELAKPAKKAKKKPAKKAKKSED